MAILILAGAASLVFWGYFIVGVNIAQSQTLAYLGLSDPFKFRLFRPWLKRYLAKRDALREMQQSFGQVSTGGWAGVRETYSNIFRPGDVYLGRSAFIGQTWYLRPIGLDTEKHMVTIAAPGAGKSTGALIPNLCIHPGSVFCIDPKGELARITAGRRGNGGGSVRGMKQEVHVLDPFKQCPDIPSASYNVMAELSKIAETDPAAVITYATVIGGALVPIQSKDPYWDKAARRFITGVILYVFQTRPKERQTLSEVRKILMEGDIEAWEAGQKSGLIADNVTSYQALLIFMKFMPESIYSRYTKYCALTITQMPEEQRGSVLTVAQEHTSFIDIPEIEAVMERSDFSLSDLKRKQMSVYLTIPIHLQKGEASGWLRMFVLLFNAMMYRDQLMPKHPVLLAIDEFPTLGNVEGIEDIGPTMRSYGVRLWVVAQDFGQLAYVYPRTWQSFIGNAEVVQFMGIKHPDTVDWLVERLGRHEVYQRRSGRWFERNLLDPDQVSRLLSKDWSFQIIWRGDYRPMVLNVTKYFNYLPYWYYDPDKRYTEPWNKRLWRFGRKGSKYRLLPSASKGEILPPRTWPAPEPDQIDEPVNYLNYEAHLKNEEPKQTESDWANELLRMEEKEAEGSRRFDVQKWIEAAAGHDPLIAQYFPRSPFQYLAPKFAKPESVKPEAKKPKPAPEPVQPEAEPVEDLGDPLAELESMIGLESVKLQVKQVMAQIRYREKRAELDLPEIVISNHLVFLGNPGTGKTTVAGIIGRLYRQIGLLKKGHMIYAKRATLVGEHIGDTAPKTLGVIQEALDGVLFIDEAYTLNVELHKTTDFGQETIETLLLEMEEHRHRLVVIVAGYPDLMEKFLDSNPGLRGRFKTKINFPDYTPEDLMKIMDEFCQKGKLELSSDARAKLTTMFADKETVYWRDNGRAVRNLFELSIERQMLRLNAHEDYGLDLIKVIEVEDIPDLSSLNVPK